MIIGVVHSNGGRVLHIEKWDVSIETNRVYVTRSILSKRRRICIRTVRPQGVVRKGNQAEDRIAGLRAGIVWSGRWIKRVSSEKSARIAIVSDTSLTHCWY